MECIVVTTGNDKAAMTKSDTGKVNADTGKKKAAERDDEIPEGFDTRVGREQGDGWLVKGPGAVVSGRIIGRFVMKGRGDDGKQRAFYQIRLNDLAGVYSGTKNQSALKGTKKDPDDQDENLDVELTTGMIVNVGEHKALEDLSPYTRDGGVYDVWFRYVSEDKIPNTRHTFWRVKGPVIKTLKPATRRPTRAAADEGEEIPF